MTLICEFSRALPNLTWLKMTWPIGDRAASAIAACRELEIVNLPRSDLTDQGFETIADLPNLVLLRIGAPRVTDAGVATLHAAQRLRYLHLIDVPLTDLSLPFIGKIERLESFYLDGGKASDAGLLQLLRSRPDLHFHRNQQHLEGDLKAHPHDGSLP